jgi:hypothetical protein
MARSCYHRDGCCDSIKGGGFLEYQDHYYFLKNHSAPGSFRNKSWMIGDITATIPQLWFILCK